MRDEFWQRSVETAGVVQAVNGAAKTWSSLVQYRKKWYVEGLKLMMAGIEAGGPRK